MALPKMTGPSYEPKEGETITVELPDERTRAVIEQKISDTAVLARISVFTSNTGKSHDYRKGQLIPCMFTRLAMNQQGWRAVTKEELDEAQRNHEERAAAEEAAQQEAEEHEEAQPREMTEGDIF